MNQNHKIHMILAANSITNFAEDIKAHLEKVFPKSSCKHSIEREDILLSQTFNPTRSQYSSTLILDRIGEAFRDLKVDRILAVVDVDLYASNLNFVFGEAQCPGTAAIISTLRLKPEFYGYSDNILYLSRIKKEAVHELGHTLGLRHCSNPKCAMHFSNSIHDTDYKDEKFCSYCENLASKIIRKTSQ